MQLESVSAIRKIAFLKILFGKEYFIKCLDHLQSLIPSQELKCYLKPACSSKLQT